MRSLLPKPPCFAAATAAAAAAATAAEAPEAASRQGGPNSQRSAYATLASTRAQCTSTFASVRLMESRCHHNVWRRPFTAGLAVLCCRWTLGRNTRKHTEQLFAPLPKVCVLFAKEESGENGTGGTNGRNYTRSSTDVLAVAPRLQHRAAARLGHMPTRNKATSFFLSIFTAAYHCILM